MNYFMDKLHLMVKLKEKIYELKSDKSKQDQVASLQKLLDQIDKNPNVKSI